MMVPAGEDHRGHVPASCSGSPRPATRSSTAATRTSATRSAATARRAERGIHFVDAGVSGGIWGLEVGYCLMVGGDDEPVSRLEPVFTALAPEDGYAHVGAVRRRATS